MGLSGNEKAVVLAKRAIQFPPANHNALPLQDYISSIRRSIHASWQSRWDQCVVDGNKLGQLKPSLGPCSLCSQLYRRLEVSVPRLRIGHTRITHGHLMVREASPVCDRCQVRLSISHILVEYPTYSVLRNQFSLL